MHRVATYYSECFVGIWLGSSRIAGFVQWNASKVARGGTEELTHRRASIALHGIKFLSCLSARLVALQATLI